MVEKQMKTFNVGDTRYIVTDAEAREDIAELQDAMSPLDVSAENGDVGKALKAKTVSGGKVTEYELGEAAIIDDTLSIAGEAADAKETGDAIADLDTAKVNKPTTSPNGTSGQLLRTNGDGTTTWVDQGLPTDEQTADAVEAWLDAHPEATTTVQDGAITKAKLDSNLQNTVDDVADLKSEIAEQLGGEITVVPELTIIDGKYVNNDGTLNTSESWFYCDYLDISDAHLHKVTITTAIRSVDNPSTCWYDASKHYLGHISGGNASEYGVTPSNNPQTFTLTLPNDAVYIRSSGYKTTMATDDMVIKYTAPRDGEVYEALNEKFDKNQGAQNAGKYICVDDNGDAAPVDLLVANLLPTDQTQTGMIVAFDSPAGEAIDVSTEASAVYRTGKNIFAFSNNTSGYSNFGQLSFDSDRQVIYLPIASGGAAYCRRNFYIPVSVGDKITVSTVCVNGNTNPSKTCLRACSTVSSASSAALDTGVTGGTYNSGFYAFIGEQGESTTYTITSEDVKYVLIGFALLSGYGWNIGDVPGIRVQAEYGDASTAWEAYTGQQKYPSSGKVSFTTLNGINTLFATRDNTLTVTYQQEHVVQSVNGKAGNVVLTPSDIGALPKDWEGHPYDIIRDNKDMIPSVFGASRYGYSSNSGWNIDKQFTMLVTTDTHGDVKQHEDALRYMDAIEPIDIGICMGDMQSVGFADNDGTWFTNPILAANKKFYPVIGNHDCGMSKSVSVAGTKAQQFSKFFAPLLTKLEMPTLQTTYYKIDATENLTIIVLDYYDNSDELADANTFVETHGSENMSQAQIDWLCNTLLNIPANTHVLIVTHFQHDAQTVVISPWSSTEKPREWEDWPWPGLLPEIINAWQNGTSLSKTYSPTYDTFKGTRTVNVDFTNRGEGIFAGFLHGHTHRDFIKKITDYPTQNSICLGTNSMALGQNGNNDLPRVYGTRTEGLVTVVTVDTIDRKIKMVRIGSQVSFAMQKRDIIAIDY